MRSRLHSLRDRGFTLIELLVVILIIGILAAIALPNFLGQTNRTHDASAKSAIRNSFTTSKTVATDNSGKYPSNLLARLNASNEVYTFQAYDSGNPIDGSDKELVTVDRVSEDEIILCNGGTTNRVYCMGSKTQGQYTTATVQSLIASAQAASPTAWGRGADDVAAHTMLTSDQGTSSFTPIKGSDQGPTTPPVSGSVQVSLGQLPASLTTTGTNTAQYTVSGDTANLFGVALCGGGTGSSYSDDYLNVLQSFDTTAPQSPCVNGGSVIGFNPSLSGNIPFSLNQNGNYSLYLLAVRFDSSTSSIETVGISPAQQVSVNIPLADAPQLASAAEYSQADGVHLTGTPGASVNAWFFIEGADYENFDNVLGSGGATFDSNGEAYIESYNGEEFALGSSVRVFTHIDPQSLPNTTVGPGLEATLTVVP